MQIVFRNSIGVPLLSRLVAFILVLRPWSRISPYRVLLCHGSPRKVNEFLWETTTSDAFLNWLFKKYNTDVIVGTHTGLQWHREPSPDKHFGVIGRPSNDGQTTVVYTVFSADTVGRQPGPQSLRGSVGGGAVPPEPTNFFPNHASSVCRLRVDFVRLVYDYERLAAEMASEGLPDEFIETILTGWWTTCNEILPAKERARGIC